LQQDETFDIQRPHFEANFVFDVIPDQIEAVHSYCCKGTPQEIIKAAVGGAERNVKMREILRGFAMHGKSLQSHGLSPGH